jgi:hypothetical protein
MKLSPVRIEEKPAMKIPTAATADVALGEDRAVGRVEGPAGL